MQRVKTLRKILAVILMIVFWLNLCLTVNANTSGKTYTITIEGSGEGHNYMIYQVFTGNLNEETCEMGDVKWGTGINQDELLKELKTSEIEIDEREIDENGVAVSTNKKVKIKDIFANCQEAYDVAYALSPYENSSDAIREFAQIIGSNLSETSVIAKKATGNKYTASNLVTGYYFIKDGNSVDTEAQTRYILDLTKNETITVKASAPEMELKVKNEEEYVEASDFQIGDTIEFQMIGKLPSKPVFDDYNSYKYIFHITFPETLEYQVDSFKTILKENNGTTTDITTYFDDAKTASEITIGCNDIKSIDEISELINTANAEIQVTYKAKLKGTTQETKNVTSAYLQFSDNPNRDGENSTSRTISNKASVYTYVLDIEKINGKIQTQKLNGVGFKIYEGNLETAKNSRKWAVIENGLITKWVNNEEEATEMKTLNEGKLNIYGLDNRTYVLKETTTLDGYNTINDMQFTINSIINNTEEEQDINTLQLQIKGKSDITLGNLDKLSFALQILNYPGGLLPETGSIGTVIFYVIGGILVVSAIILVLPIKKKKKSK